MARQNQSSDAKLIARINRRKRAFTAADVGVRVDKLRQLEAQGIIASVGRVHTGHAGRPQERFIRADLAARASAAAERGTDPSAESRTGELSEQEAS